MKIVFYRHLLTEKQGLTPNERMLYSLLVSKSLLIIDEVFNSDGENMDMEYVYDMLSNDEYIEINHISIHNIMRALNISEQSVLNGMRTLKDLGIILDNNIHVPKSLLKRGYFEINTQIPLKGELLVFYHYLKDKAKRYGGCIDTFKYKLAEETGTTIIAIKQSLNKLYKRGYIKRLENGKLQVIG